MRRILGWTTAALVAFVFLAPRWWIDARPARRDLITR